jgi:predicted acylesterase/phospholipase RssA
MAIDTLILSGGGPSGVAYIGIFRALFERRIIDRNLSGIKEIITTSVGIMFAVALMLKIHDDQIEQIIEGMDFMKMVNMDDLEIDNLLVDFGLFGNEIIGKTISALARHKLDREDISLSELYEIVPIRLTVKVYNVSTNHLEYINHETDPDLKISLLAEMTTAIPFFFKPVEYNGHSYVDGGLRGHFPIEKCVSGNYLGIFIMGGSFPKESALVTLFPLIRFVHSLMINQDDIIREIKSGKVFKDIIYTEINEGLNFDMNTNEKKIIIKKGYDDAMNHINEHLI